MNYVSTSGRLLPNGISNLGRKLITSGQNTQFLQRLKKPLLLAPPEKTLLLAPRIRDLQADFDKHPDGRIKLLYGIEKHREALRTMFFPPIDNPRTSTHPLSKSENLIETKGLNTADVLNNFAWRDLTGSPDHFPFGKSSSNSSDDKLKSEMNSRSQDRMEVQKRSPSERAIIQNYSEAFFKSPASVLITRKKNANDLSMKEFGIPATNADDERDARFRYQTIAASEFGLGYAKGNSGTVYFELGDMNTADAARNAKVGRKDRKNRQLRSVTNAELTHAFKNDWEDLKFYRRGDKVDAPWVRLDGKEGKAWLERLDRRTKKYQKAGFVHDHEVVARAFHKNNREGFRVAHQQINEFKENKGKWVKS